MSKVKYYYDSETLSYRKIEQKKGRKTGLFLLSLLGIVLSGFLLMLVFLNLPNFETPKEKELKRELTNLEFQLEVLNKKMNEAETVLNELQNATITYTVFILKRTRYLKNKEKQDLEVLIDITN